MVDKEAREEQKERKLRRMTKFQQSCKAPGMNCFTVDNSTWEVEPRWTGAPQEGFFRLNMLRFPLSRINTVARTSGDLYF